MKVAHLGNNATYEIAVPSLIETRLLIQSNSGGGKSWALRRILEQTAGLVQQIVIDPEGEFSTLREKHDYIICAPHGADAVATPKTAKLLARKLLETGVSAVVDIYELKAHERQEFVRLFLDSLVNAPKKLWHPVMVVLDEAHMFAPEKGKSVSTGAVIDIATRGRKRGLCLIAATQRLSKLHKDVAAELLNKMIGRTGLDLDIKRVGDELGMSKSDAWQLKDLSPGEFHIYGPAFTRSVTKVKIGKVATSHGNEQNAQMTPSAPSAKIKKILESLKDLPTQAEEEARSVAELRQQLRLANTRIRTLEKSGGIPEAEINKRISEIVDNLPSPEDVTDAWQAGKVERSKEIEEEWADSIVPLFDKLQSDAREVLKGELSKQGEKRPSLPPSISRPVIMNPKPAQGTLKPVDGDVSLRAGVVRILSVLAVRFPAGYSKSQLSVLAKFKPTSGTFSTYLGDLRRAGFLKEEGTGRDRMYYTTEEGVLYMGNDLPSAPITHAEAMSQWRPKLRAGCFRILEVIVAAGPSGIHKLDIATEVGMVPTSGTYSTYLGDIRRNELASESGDKVWIANDILFPEREN